MVQWKNIYDTMDKTMVLYRVQEEISIYEGKKTCQITKNKETDNGKNYGIYNFRTLIYYEKKL